VCSDEAIIGTTDLCRVNFKDAGTDSGGAAVLMMGADDRGE